MKDFHTSPTLVCLLECVDIYNGQRDVFEALAPVDITRVSYNTNHEEPDMGHRDSMRFFYQRNAPKSISPAKVEGEDIVKRSL